MRHATFFARATPRVATVAAALALIAASACEKNPSPAAPAPVTPAAPATPPPAPAPVTPPPTTTPAPVAPAPAPATPAPAVPPTTPNAVPPAAPAEIPWPRGDDTPEGIACDLARAFITGDDALFLASCVEARGEFERPEYAKFLRDTVAQIKEARRTGLERNHGPKKIVKLFIARPLSRSGPNSYVHAANIGKDIRFVDVICDLHGGGTLASRTLVLQKTSGDWLAIPMPESFPFLSDGLNDEPDSTVEWKSK